MSSDHDQETRRNIRRVAGVSVQPIQELPSRRPLTPVRATVHQMRCSYYAPRAGDHTLLMIRYLDVICNLEGPVGIRRLVFPTDKQHTSPSTES